MGAHGAVRGLKFGEPVFIRAGAFFWDLRVHILIPIPCVCFDFSVACESISPWTNYMHRDWQKKTLAARMLGLMNAGGCYQARCRHDYHRLVAVAHVCMLMLCTIVVHCQ